MKTIKGQYTNALITTNTADEATITQIQNICNNKAFEGCKISIMPDCHAGNDCVVGFTSTIKDKVIPSIVGSDIACGMLTVDLGNIEIDLKNLDKVIKEGIPASYSMHDKLYRASMISKNIAEGTVLSCTNNIDRILRSLGTLGSGNHFIEIDVDDEGTKYLVIHTGSRNLGAQVCKYYQELAYKESAPQIDIPAVIANLKANGKEKDIQEVLTALKKIQPIKDNMASLSGKSLNNYLTDAMFCMHYAEENRNIIADIICKGMGWNIDELEKFHTVHNYIGEDRIIRKGAISARANEIVLIPMNMRDGSLLCVGLGNSLWNFSAPHGAGRTMSRSVAFKTLNVEEYKDTMKGIYSSTVVGETLDEAPDAYKPMQEIIDNVGKTVQILKHLKPIYNYKEIDYKPWLSKK